MTEISQPDQTDTISLTLLATTDLHMHLTGWDYAKDAPLPHGGLPRVAAEITRIRADAAAQGHPVLLFDNGDAAQGTVLGELAQARRDHPHPLMRCFAALGYDVIGLGNHDFDFGLEGLSHLMAEAPCPVISSVLDPRPQGIEHSATLTVGTDLGPVRIGLLSVLPQQTALWNADRLTGKLRIAEMVGAARDTAAELRANGCDLVIALAHTGIEDAAYTPGQENAARAIAGLDVDAVFAGHTHLPFAGLISDTPVALAGANGTQMARIDLRLRAQDGGWTVANAEPVLLDMNAEAEALPTDPDLRALLQPWHDAARDQMNTPVGHAAQPLHSYFSMVRPDAHLHHIAEAMHGAACGGGTLPDLPIISVIAPAKCGGRGGPDHYTDVAPGPVLQRHVQDLTLFPNTLRAVQIEGHHLREWMEMAASVFHPLGHASGQLLNEDWPPHSFDVFFGLDYEIDLRAPARYRPDGQLRDAGARRIRNLRRGGSPLQDQDTLIALLTDYRVSGGGNVPGLPQLPRLDLPTLPLRQAVADHLTTDVAPAYDPCPWRFTPADGQTARFLSGPGALRFLDDIAALTPQPGTPDAEGFVPITLTF